MKTKLLLFVTLAFTGLSMDAQNTSLPEGSAGTAKHNSLNWQNNINKQHLVSSLGAENPDRGINSIIFLWNKAIFSNWDTLNNAWTFNDSTRNTYNSSGNVTLGLSYSNDPTHPYKDIYIYNGNGKKTSDTTWYWDGTAYVKNGFVTDTYDIHGNQTDVSNYSWNGTAWITNYKVDYTYDANNNQTQEIVQQWNGSALLNSYKYNDAYDANNNHIQQSTQHWDTTAHAWNNSYQSLYTWTGTQLTEIIDQNGNGTAWVNDQKNDFTYASGQISGVLGYKWNGTSSSWYNNLKAINIVWYQWNGSIFNSKLASDLEQVPNGSSWKDSTKYNITYDIHGNQTDYLEQSKPSTTYITTYEQKHIFQYDGNNNMTEDIYQQWNQSTHSARNYNKVDYSDFRQYTGINEITNDGTFMLYPNPNQGKFQVQSSKRLLSGAEPFKITSIVIYNLVGEKVYQAAINNSQAEINLSAQPKGIYFVQVIDENKNVVNKKIIVQ